jgi:hypothetical protein
MTAVQGHLVKGRPSPVTRRAGYVIAIAVNIVLLYLINVRPGWAAVPFLTQETLRILYLMNLSLVVGAAVNVLYLGHDPRWLVALGGLATTGIGVVVLFRIWQVFPFAFTGGVDWALFVRILLVLAVVGSLIGLIVQAVLLTTAVTAPARRRS